MPMQTRGLLCLVTTIAALLPTPGRATSPCAPPPPGPWSARRGVVAQDTVWEVAPDGTLVTFRPGESRQRVEAVPEPVVAVCANPDGDVAVLTCAPAGDRWTFRVRVDGAWIAAATFAPQGDELVDLTCTGDPVLFTSKRILSVRDGRVTSTDLGRSPGARRATPPPPGCDVEPIRAGERSSLTRAVHARGRLWMTSDAGEVFSVAEGEAALRTESLPEATLDLCTRGANLYALTCGAYGTRWTLRRWADAGWMAEVAFSPGADEFRGLVCAAGHTTVVTSDRVLVARAGKVRTSRLARPLPRAVTSVAHADGAHVLIGLSLGEFGGALHRLDPRTGAIEQVGECGGGRARCVRGVLAMADEPWKRGCVAAAAGLVHLGSESGQLVEICGGEVHRLAPRARTAFAAGGEPPERTFSAHGFFGVARVGDAIVASGIDALYRLDARGFDRLPLPALTDVGGVQVSFAISGVVLVATEISRRASTGAATAMVVAR